uniref:Uncharacterized protein n=1 Tax=Tanacetum cinerariifolium TaxID=118510 RepID=A0A699HRT6_TANCI|nr:hypothetical protein [Tanacetum cinerariifolium]
MWEDFVYQVEHKDTKKSNEMYYPRNSDAYKEYYAVATGATPPKTKASVQKTKSSFDTTVTPPLTTAVGPRLSTSAKGKQPATTSKAKSLTALSKEYKGDDDKYDQEEGSDDEQASDKEDEEFIHPSLSTHDEEETRYDESFDPIPKTPKNTDDEGNGEENLGTNVSREEGHDEEDEEEELYRDVNINLGRGIIKEQVKEQVKVQVSKILPKIKQTVNEQLEAEVLTQSSNSSKTSYAVAGDLSEMELKKILIEKMEGKKSIHRSNEQRNLYKGLVEAYESYNIILDTYGDTVKLKRRLDDDADKDEEPSAGSDRGESAIAEEPMLTTHEIEELSHLEFETGADDQPILEPSQHLEWFSQQKKPPTLDRDWNKTLPATHGSIQPWIRELEKQSDSHSSFNELMDTPMEFSAFLMNRLKVDTLTPELLASPTYELIKGSCKSLVELEFFLEEVYKATTDQLDWVNPEGKLTNLSVEERFAFNVSLRMFTRSIVIQRRVEDLQLGVESYQKKLNLTRSDTYRSDLKRKEAYIAYSNPRGFIYQNKNKQNRDSDEVYAIVNLEESDKDRAAAMIQAIDKQLKTRRIMRSLERFVGGRLHEGDFRMLQRTI